MTDLADLLTVRDLSVSYGPIRAVRSASFRLPERQVMAILGRNGAGKSSLLNAIAGIVPRASGDVLLKGRPLARSAPEAIVRAGISLVPEGRNIFRTLTVEENLRLGATPRSDRVAIRADLEEIYRRFEILFTYRFQKAGALSGGEQQQLAIARGLMARPAILLLDEPSLGLSPIMTDRVYAVIRQLKEDGLTILLVEQFAERALEVADAIILLRNGKIDTLTTASQIRSNKDLLREAYLASGGPEL